MARLKGKCIGDCSRCELLSAGEVDMIPCILDQMFARIKRQGADLEEIKKKIGEREKPSGVQLAEIEDEEEEE